MGNSFPLGSTSRYLLSICKGQYANITMTNVVNGLVAESSLWNSIVFQGHVSIKVSKGQSVFITYNDIYQVHWFRFIYAKGAV